MIDALLCRLGFHYDVHQNAYYIGEDWFQTERCGQVKLCLRCGRIKKIGVVSIPDYYRTWSKEIRGA